MMPLSLKILLVGPTLAGKSAFVNTVFSSFYNTTQEIAKVEGDTSRVGTSQLARYQLGDNLIISDCTGVDLLSENFDRELHLLRTALEGKLKEGKNLPELIKPEKKLTPRGTRTKTIGWTLDKEAINQSPQTPSAVLLILSWDCLHEVPDLFWRNLEYLLSLTAGKKWFAVVNKCDMEFEDALKCRRLLVDDCNPPSLPELFRNYLIETHADKVCMIDGLEVIWCYCHRWKEEHWEMTESMKARSLGLLCHILYQLQANDPHT